MQYRFLFRVRFWDDEERKLREERGVFNAVSFREAMNTLATWYGDGALDCVELYGFDEGMVFLTEVDFDRFKDDPDKPV